ncbi:aldo/keto reductase [Blastococcus capsensis]|uniref:aldo/keto reductase n=1 Tax=Blastococcus capsensis TaxID=1564163 RepID=UPI003D6A23A8
MRRPGPVAPWTRAVPHGRARTPTREVRPTECRRFGRPGLQVSACGPGGGGESRLGLRKGPTEDEAIDLVRRAVDLRTTYFDTAPNYGTEGVIGRALEGCRHEAVVSSKTVARRPDGSMVDAAGGDLRAGDRRRDHGFGAQLLQPGPSSWLRRSRGWPTTVWWTVARSTSGARSVSCSTRWTWPPSRGVLPVRRPRAGALRPDLRRGLRIPAVRSGFSAGVPHRWWTGAGDGPAPPRPLPRRTIMLPARQSSRRDSSPSGHIRR